MKSKFLVWVFILVILNISAFAFADLPYPDDDPFDATIHWKLDNSCNDEIGSNICINNNGIYNNTETPFGSGYSVYYNGTSGDYLNTNFTEVLRNSFAYSFWIKTTSVDNGDYYFGATQSGATKDIHLSHSDTLGLTIQLHEEEGGTQELYVRTTDTLNNGSWQHVVINKRSGGKAGIIEIYVNGINQSLIIGRDEDPDNITVPFPIFFMADNFDGGAINNMQGFLDDILIFKGKYLSGNEIQTIYEGNYSDTVPPTITFDYPVNETHYNDYSGYINITIDENGNCSLNDSRWGLHSESSTFFSFLNNSPITDDDYVINVSCWDDEPTPNNDSKLLYFTIDTISPAITWYYPATDLTTNKNFTLNVSVYDVNLYRVNVTFYNQTNSVIYNNLYNDVDATLLNITTELNFTTGEGTYNITIAATDDHTFGSLRGLEYNVFNNKLQFYKDDKKLDILYGYWQDGAFYFFTNQQIIDNSISTQIAKGKGEYKYNLSFQKPAQDIGFGFAIEKNKVKVRDSNTGHLIWRDWYLDFEDLIENGFPLTFTEYGNYYVIYSNTAYCAGVAGETCVFDPVAGGLNVKEESKLVIYANTPPEITSPTITPTPAYADSILNASTTYTDVDTDTGTVYFKWYVNNMNVYSQTFSSIANGTTVVSSLAPGNFSRDDQVNVSVYANDGVDDSSVKWSSTITIQSRPPEHSTPLLSSTSGKNLTTDNLTCYNQSTFDADGDSVRNIFNWKLDGNSITVLNMPFEADGNQNATDYSGYENNGMANGTTWNGSGGYDSKGAYQFDGSDDYIRVGIINSLNKSSGATFTAWIKSASSSANKVIYSYGGTNNWIILWVVGTTLQLWDDIGNANSGINGGEIYPDVWYHVALIVYENTTKELYINGEINGSGTGSGRNLSGITYYNLRIGRRADDPYPFNGTIDEAMIWNRILSAEQIQALYEGRTDLIVSQETSVGEEYVCSITPNDGYVNGETLDSHPLLVKWAITFNVTGSEQERPERDGVIISCNYTGFSQAGDTTNMYGPYGFPPGDWQCIFEKTFYFDKTQTFTADGDKTIEVILPQTGGATYEEHTWLEALYNCIILKQCDLYNLLLQINDTVGNIWEHTKPTDESVVTSEVITNKIVNSTHNLTIDYTVSIPIKAGYNLGAYLPVRIGYWFLDTTNTSCYNQGDQPTGVADPYCQPLVIETIGPMGGSVSFTVELQPSLPAGDYSIKRMIDIDPNDEWINYGQEKIDTITVTEDMDGYGIGLEKTGEENPTTNNNQQQSGSGGGGGSGSRVIISPKESNPVTNIYQNITNIIVRQEEKQEPKEYTSNEEKAVVEEETKPEDSGFGGLITGAVVGLTNGITSNLGMTGILIVICLLLGGLVIHYRAKSKKK